MKFTSVDEYIASFPEEVRKVLEEVRATIRTVAPQAREKISYNMAAFELDGMNLIYFAGWKRHISLYPIPSGDESFNTRIAPYIDGKGTLKFPLDKPLPFDLIRGIVEATPTRRSRSTARSASRQPRAC